jgi:hypothetical protein
MPVIDSENALRKTDGPAKLERFEPGTLISGMPINATNVQDAIDQVAAAIDTGGGTTLPEAPINGQTYGRLNATWAVIPGTSTVTLTGDVTGVGGVTVATTLATVNPTVGTYQGITVNAKGLVTSATNLGYLTGNQTVTLSGDVSGSGTTAITATLATVNANVGTFQGITVNAKGLVTAAVNQNYAPLASPTFTGTPAAPTPISSDNSTTLATTAFVQSLVGLPGVVPENSKSANYTTIITDAGKFLYHPSSDANARTFTIDSNANVPYALGTIISFVNLSANALTIAIATDTMYLMGPGTTGSRTLAQYGCATALKTDATVWIISGTGLT